MGLRSAVALQQGADESLLAAAVAPEAAAELSGCHRAALRVADAFLGSPANVDAAAWAELMEELSPEQVAEIVLWLTKCSRNKVRVALGLDVDVIRRQIY